MENVLETLSIVITANTKEVEKATKGLKGTFDNLDKQSNIMAAAVVGATAAVGTAMFAMATKTANAASAIADSSKQVGMGTTEYQKWTFAAKQSGIEVDKLNSIMKRQQTSFSDATAGSKIAADAYSDLGVDIKGLTSEGAFDAVITKLAGMTDLTERNRLANDIFGKSYSDLAPLLAEGATGIQNLKQQAVDLGGVMSEDAVNAGDTFGDTLDKLKTATDGIWNTIGTALIPTFQKLADWVIANKDKVFASLESTLTAIGNAIKWMADNSDWLLPILGTLVGIFIAFKIAMAAFNIVLAIQNAIWLANPITWIVLGIVALIAAIVLLWTNWDNIMKWMGSTFKDFGNGVIGVINIIIDGINWMIKGALSPINSLIKGWNATIGKLAGKIPEITISINAIPKLANGGILNAGSAFIAGEAGRELMGSYQGKTTVMPLENTSFVSTMGKAVYSAVVSALSEQSNGQLILQVDGMTLAKSVEKNLNKLSTQQGGLNIAL